MDSLEQIDQRLADVVDTSANLLGFVRESEAPIWTLLFADDAWVDVDMRGDGLLSIGTEIGGLPDLLASQRMNELMLSYAGFTPDTAFSMTPDGVRHLRQYMPRDALDQPGFITTVEGFVAKAQAWRELLQTPPRPSARVAAEAHPGLLLDMRG
ncbi:MAG: type III secretion system chaperone [Hydrogenophaga sp.]|uniref:hypothetical protein n=1 Tax=Hydrogenophaga sp. TaxID=1904254 RepID=UPI001E14EAF1|nr:hypothetical protein [Hydrogenophaga sp.]MBX3611143.1 type III secretion system chaperone [Hydrogenophaga sp.]